LVAVLNRQLYPIVRMLSEMGIVAEVVVGARNHDL
jgi:hypothetical protein